MQTTVNFVIEYPNNCGIILHIDLESGELGLSLNTMGKFVIVEQASGQSESYGIRYEDRIISVNNQNCISETPTSVVGRIQKSLCCVHAI